MLSRLVRGWDALDKMLNRTMAHTEDRGLKYAEGKGDRDADRGSGAGVFAAEFPKTASPAVAFGPTGSSKFALWISGYMRFIVKGAGVGFVLQRYPEREDRNRSEWKEGRYGPQPSQIGQRRGLPLAFGRRISQHSAEKMEKDRENRHGKRS